MAQSLTSQTFSLPPILHQYTSSLNQHQTINMFNNPILYYKLFENFSRWCWLGDQKVLNKKIIKGMQWDTNTNIVIRQMVVTNQNRQWLPCPMHVPSQTQWWSNWRTHLSQSWQCFALGGWKKFTHIKEKHNRNLTKYWIWKEWGAAYAAT